MDVLYGIWLDQVEFSWVDLWLGRSMTIWSVFGFCVDLEFYGYLVHCIKHFKDSDSCVLTQWIQTQTALFLAHLVVKSLFLKTPLPIWTCMQLQKEIWLKTHVSPFQTKFCSNCLYLYFSIITSAPSSLQATNQRILCMWVDFISTSSSSSSPTRTSSSKPKHLSIFQSPCSFGKLLLH